MIKIIPAIDIKGGKVVRLARGDFKQEIIYSDSPVEVAEKWAAFGVGLIHIVDLDGALEGVPINLDIIKEIAKTVKVKIELGGGIRTIDAIKTALDSGIAKVVLGTKALDEKFIEEASAKYREHIVVGIDARDGMVCTKGWISKTDVPATDLAKAVQGYGIRTINFTDISRDGMLEGPNTESLKSLLNATTLDVVASGGVSNINDIKKLLSIKNDRLVGIIIGKALYEKKIDLKEAIDACRG